MRRFKFFLAQMVSLLFLVGQASGQEASLIEAKMGEFVNRKGIYPPLPDADKIQFVPMDELSVKAYADKKNEYRDLFLRQKF